MRLRDGSWTEDPRLDRLRQFDERSRSYSVAAVTPQLPVRGRSWSCRPRLNQGQEGACVGFSCAHELAATPVTAKVDYNYARFIYKEAQKIDPWPGESYEGTSVLAGVKILEREGHITEYRWSFGIEDYINALAHVGPAIMGTWWLRSMFSPRPSGLMEVDFTSGVAGGHAYLARGLILKPRLKGESRSLGPLVRVRNSWGEDWGVRGDCFFKLDDLARLLSEDGEACFPVVRQKKS